jgi:acyl carrier protein
MTENGSDILGVSRLGENGSTGSHSGVDEGFTPDPPATPTEIKLAEIWSLVLPEGQIQRTDNFIALGGDSLGLAQVITDVDEIYHVSLPSEVIANNLTLVDLANAIDRAVADNRDPK